MKLAQLSLSTAIFLIAASLTFNSCRKEDKKIETPKTNTPSAADTETKTVIDNNLAESIANDIESIGAQTSENQNAVNYRTAASCYTISADLPNKTFTVDFGTSNCVGGDGHVRKGKLIYDFSASAANVTSYRNPGFHVSVTAQNYSVDGYSVTINNKTIANTTPTTIPTGANPGTNLTWSINANLTIVKPINQDTITWVCNRSKELLNTSDSTCYQGQNHFIDWTKAKVQINGTANGTNASGSSYSVTATNMVIDFQCSPDPNYPYRHPFISGTLAYTPGSHPTRTINYGSGTCDLTATITVASITATFTLP